MYKKWHIIWFFFFATIFVSNQIIYAKNQINNKVSHQTKKTVKKVSKKTKKPKKIELKTPEEVGINAKYFPVTVLSQRAMQLKIGMTREEVFALMGKPMWADRHEGAPLEWTWVNGQCNPIEVTFDNDMHVNGFDQGRQKCFEGEYTLGLPDDETLCTNESIAKLCNPGTSFNEEM